MLHVGISVLLHLALFDIGCTVEDIHVDGYFRWTHDNIATKELLCPECCQKDHTDRCLPINSDFSTDKTTICCVFRAKPYWKFPKYSYLRVYSGLRVKYETSNGKAYIYESFSRFNNYFVNFKLSSLDVGLTNFSFYDLDHQDGQLLSFPENLCQFPKIVYLNVSKNNITDVKDLGCLKVLDTLDISYNQLKLVRSFTFANLPYLRYLYLSNNYIKTVEPGAFRYHPTSLKLVDLSNNRLLTLDITNGILGYFFYFLDYSYNFITNFTNLSNWKGFQDGDEIGGGWIDLRYNNFTRMPNLRNIGFGNMRSLFKIVFNYHVGLANNPWICDCFAYSYMNIFVQAKRHFSVAGIECAQPKSLKGFSIPEFRTNKLLLHKLTCKVTMKEKCPPKCHCFKQPSMDRVVVNCSLTDRSRMPKIIPDLNNIDLDLSKNRIEIFQNHDYLRRTIKIDLSHNKIHIIEPNVFTIKHLDIIHLYNNSLTSLHRSVQLRSPCKLRLGHISLARCKCEMYWIKIWLEKQSSMKCLEKVNMITCKHNVMQVNISDLSKDELCPQVTRTNSSYIGFVAAISIIILLTLLYLHFRYELLLILRHNIYLHRQNFHRKIIYDVYLSFNIENSDVRIWTIQTLVSHLESRGYHVCLPARDFEFGGIHSEQIHEMIARARSFLIILSDDYFESQFQIIEWMHIWDAFKADIDSNLLVINHDILNIKDVHDRKLKAVLRLGYSLDFSDFKNDLLKETEKRLRNKMSNRRYWVSSRTIKTETETAL